MPLQLKVDDNGTVVTVEKEGVLYPLYVDEEGKDIEVDASGLFDKIASLNSEAKGYRQSKSEIKEKYKIFDDIEDLEEWKTNAEKAMETVKNYDDKKLVDAGKVEQLKQEMRDTFETEKSGIHDSYREKMTEYENGLSEKDNKIYHLMVSTRFAQSPYFSGKDPKSTLPPEMAEAYFGKNFKVEDNGKGDLRVVGYRSNGQQILSRLAPNVGEIAGFEEALEEVIKEYPYKDRILRSTGGGSGAGGGDGDGGRPKGIDAKIADAEKQLQEAKEAKNGALVTTLTTRIHQLKVQKQTGQQA